VLPHFDLAVPPGATGKPVTSSYSEILTPKCLRTAELGRNFGGSLSHSKTSN
jgi:hypothetical protein